MLLSYILTDLRHIFLKVPAIVDGWPRAAARGSVPLSHGVAAATALRSTACRHPTVPPCRAPPVLGR